MINLKNKLKEIKLNGKKLCLITDSDGFDSENDFLDALAAALFGGVGIVLFREKNLPAKKVLALGKKVRELCLQFDATFIVNDRADIALLLESDSLHLGQDDLDVKSAREILGENSIVGVSTKDLNQAQKAVKDGADYIFLGPVFMDFDKKKEISTKFEDLKQVTENIQIPVFVTGEINPKNIQKILDTGLSRVAVGFSKANLQSRENFVKDLISKLG